MPVYELTPDGHSTHMYGALVPWVQGEIFLYAGPNNVSGASDASLGTPDRHPARVDDARNCFSAWYLVIAWSIIFGVNHRTMEYFAENLLDVSAMMFTASALLLLGYGQENKIWGYVVAGRCRCWLFLQADGLRLRRRARRRIGVTPEEARDRGGRHGIDADLRRRCGHCRLKGLGTRRLLLYDRGPAGLSRQLAEGGAGRLGIIARFPVSPPPHRGVDRRRRGLFAGATGGSYGWWRCCRSPSRSAP